MRVKIKICQVQSTYVPWGRVVGEGFKSGFKPKTTSLEAGMWQAGKESPPFPLLGARLLWRNNSGLYGAQLQVGSYLDALLDTSSSPVAPCRPAWFTGYPPLAMQRRHHQRNTPRPYPEHQFVS